MVVLKSGNLNAKKWFRFSAVGSSVLGQAPRGVNMKRRQFIKTGVVGGLTVSVIGAGLWLNIPSNKAPLTIEAALAKLDEFSKQEILSSGVWNPYQIFTHCAQSVEFSLTGFPEHKSDVFKHTVGYLAFSAFSSKGQMTHSLSEPIPGAPRIDSEQDIQSALNRFKISLLDFEQFKGKLAPHFAYGELTKQDYERAHVMHFYNHLKEIIT